MKPRYLPMLASALTCALLAGPATAADYQMIMSNDNNNKGLKGQTFELLASEIRQRLGDRIDLELHHSGTLFDQQSQIQGLQLGGTHIISPTTGIYSSVTPKVGALNLPFMLNTPEEISNAIADPVVGSAFMPELNAQNIEIIAVWMNGPRDLGYRGDKPVLLPEDVDGMKVRVQSAPIFVKTWEAVGANAVGINWSEAPTALQQGVIDAGEVTPNSWKGSGTYQMIDQLSMTDHQYSFYLVGANKQWWDDMPADIKTEVQAALDVATAWNIENVVLINDAAVDFMAAEGVKVHTLDEQQKQAWVTAMQPVWNELGDQLVGEEVMARLKEIANVQ